MTIIAYKDGVLAADSGTWSDGRCQRCAFPKITRGPDGSLWALTGKEADAWFLREWVLAGADEAKPPTFLEKGDDAPCVILVRPDDRLWSIKFEWRATLTVQRGCWGEPSAAHFCEGAMEAGLSAPEAVELTTRHHTYAMAPVQVERVRRCLTHQP